MDPPPEEILGPQREAARRVWAEQHGWQYPAPVGPLHRRWPGPPFDVTVELGGENRTEAAATGGYRERTAAVFDFTYLVDGPPGANWTNSMSVCVLRSFAEPRRLLAIHRQAHERREGKIAAVWDGWLASAGFGSPVGVEPIRLPNPVFAERYEVRGDDARFAATVFDQHLMQWLISSDAPSWRLDGQDALVWQPGSWTPASADADFAFLDELLTRIAATPPA